MGRLAARQFGVVGSRQLRECGLSTSRVSDWVRAGRLIRVHRGVYAVGHAALRPEGLRLAVVLACGPGAVLSHRSAAEWWGLRPHHGTRFELTTTGRHGRAVAGVRPYHRALDPSERTVREGVPVTTVARTLLDLATVLTAGHVARAVERAEELRLLDLREVEAVVARQPPRARGLRRLRTALADFVPIAEDTRSELERLALELVARARLPRPSANATVEGHCVDLLWRRQRVVVELDSRRHHLNPAAFERDRRRDAELAASGYRVVRFTWRQVVGEPGRVADVLTRMLRTPGARRTRVRG